MSVDFSVVVPVCNEAENVEPLAREIDAALNSRSYEMIFVDDGSTDETAAILKKLKSVAAGAARVAPFVSQRAERRGGERRARGARALGGHARWRRPERSGRHSEAHRGARRARRPRRAALHGQSQGAVARTRRSASCSRASRTACAVVCWVMARRTPAAASSSSRAKCSWSCRASITCIASCPRCSSATARASISVPVSHRARTRGTSKYGMLNRLWVGIVDIGGVMWLRRRYKSGLLVREE